MACSGGLDTRVAVPWLAQSYGVEVVALTLDLGQGGALEAVRDGALQHGAARAHVLDVREEFARDYVLPALRADALDDGGLPMPAALSRPLIARKLVDIAGMEGATAIAHARVTDRRAAGSIRVAARALAPALEIIATPREWRVNESPIHASTHGASTAPQDEASDADANLWGRSLVQAATAPAVWPPAAFFRRTRAPEHCPDEPALVEIGFDRGVPASLNGVAMGPVELVAALDAIAGGNGIGRLDTGAREVREAPAAVVLHAAHAALWARLAPGEAVERHHQISLAYADLIRDGHWFSPARAALDAAEQSVQDTLTGGVRLRLRQGDCRLATDDE
jgi:argininosuccinate synthase